MSRFTNIAVILATSCLAISTPGVAQTAQVLALIRRLREHGLGVVIITHNLHEVFEVADRIIVLRLGRRVATFKHDETTPEAVVAAITGATRQAA